jgi:phage FluMu gp28-like protein
VHAVLRPYQVWLATDPHPYVALQKARRIGGSFGVAHRAALRAMGLQVLATGDLHDAPRGGTEQKLISASQEQSNELLAEVFQHVEAVAKVWPDQRCWPKGEPNKTSFRLRSGVRVRAFPDNPRTARGGEGDVTLDEFAFMRDQRAMWAAVKYIADANLANPEGYRLTVCTTPLGEGSLAHQVCMGDQSARDRFRHFSRYRIDIHSAVRRGFPDPTWTEEQRVEYIERQRREAGDPETFAQECECSWLAAHSQFLSLELLNSRRYEADELPKGGDLYAGVDVARKRHLTAIARVRKIGDVMWALPITSPEYLLRQQPFDVQHEAIGRVIQVEGAHRVCMDATGMGSAPAERLEKDYPGKVEGVEFTSAVKEGLATTLKLALDSGRLRLPFDPELIFDLAKLRKMVTTAGNIRYDADDSGGSHADRAWGLALAVHAASRPVPKDAGRTQPRRDHRHDMAGLYD